MFRRIVVVKKRRILYDKFKIKCVYLFCPDTYGESAYHNTSDYAFFENMICHKHNDVWNKNWYNKPIKGYASR